MTFVMSFWHFMSDPEPEPDPECILVPAIQVLPYNTGSIYAPWQPAVHNLFNVEPSS